MFSKHIRKWSLTRQFLILYFVTIILVMLVFFAITYVSSHNTMMDIGTQNTQTVANSSLMQLSSMIDDIEYQFFLMQNNHELQHLLSDSCTDPVETQVDKIGNILSSYDVFQRRIQKFELYSLTKDYYPSVRNVQENVFRSSELAHDIWFNSVLSGGYKSLFVINDINEETYITMSKLIVDTNSREPIAIIKAYINAATFCSLIKDIRIMESGRMFITTDTHIINPSQDKLISQFVNNPDIYNQIIPKQIPSSLIHTSNARYRILCNPVRETGLYLISFVNTDEFNTLGHSMIFSIALASLLLMLFVFLILYFISSSFIKPIKLLSHDMSCFEESNPSKVSIPHSETSVEISSLYRSYESMRGTITHLLESTKTQARIQRETEFRLLQAQIKPHFLYNTLGSISALADKINATEIKQLASSLATYFRTSLNNGKELITLRDELEQAISYAEIQKIRYPDKFELKILVSEEIMDFTVCKLILQPLIENCITHAFKGMDRKGIIEISGTLENDDIILSVSDNGYGLNYISVDTLNGYAEARDDEDGFTSNHFGIYNIAQRIHLYYGKNYGLSYTENDMGGITATIRLSQKTQYDF